MTRKALFFDIDGTLVSFQTHEIPTSTLHALQEAKALGMNIFIATGRPRILINNLDALQKNDLIDGYITMNGAYCFIGEKVLYKSAIPADDTHTLTHFCAERQIPCIVVGENDIIFAYYDAGNLTFCTEMGQCMCVVCRYSTFIQYLFAYKTIGPVHGDVSVY